MIKKYLIAVCILMAVVFPVISWGQSVSGKVVDCANNQPIQGVLVRIIKANNGATTDKGGVYQIHHLEAGSWEIEFSCLGMKTVTKTVKFDRDTPLTLHVCMENAVTDLGEVVVAARHERKELKNAREQGVPVSVIDGKMLAGRGTSITEVINHQTGVKVRRTGSVGSDTKVNVRGLEGNRVQIYIDGQALNSPDGSFSINDIPLQFIDRIEIYKGIVPPEFGGDGLGSAINIVTIDAEESFYDLWYGISSYNTHESSITYKHWLPKSQIMLSAMYGFGYAGNNYKMQSPYVEGLTIKRDHDRFRKHLGEVSIDFRGTYFDEFEIGVPFYVNDRQIQGIKTNIQKAQTSGWMTGAELTLEKDGFLTPKLDMKFSGLARFSGTHLNDTSSYLYNFDGSQIPNTYRGEIGSIPNLSDDKLKDYRYTLNFKYNLRPGTKLNFNNDFRFVSTEFNDTVADNYRKTQNSGLKADVINVISSINLEQRLWERLYLLLTARNYYNRVKGATVDLTYGAGNSEVVHADESRLSWGGSIAAKYDFAQHWLLKFAFEHNYRLPRSEELLGDRLWITSNTQLRPEQANNLNLGVMYNNQYNNFSRLQFEGNIYTMHITDMIMMRTASGFMANYNIGKAHLYGADAEVKWDIDRNWFVMLNATYQKTIDKTRYLPGTNTPSVTYDMQMPHIPIFFLNWSLDYRKDNLFGGKGQYNRFYYEGGYTDKYYFGYKLAANQSYVIPSSCIHTAGIEYAMMDRRLLFSLECHNLFDTKELTNLNYPLAGRTFQAKVRITTLKW
ncbi:TonB-dependent receptor [Parabacteroides sp. 52]|uniref:TonB-dependent receptor n=1 Tax=unclassified Parabacteroides TaxID=2649774 RepID=UPI0013D36EB5|nr:MULTISPECIES: TonB-dependent receptor [unclassified Parabacteroides]MDH6533862.1 vitamin B12 transporter [Parabacteroides sp. PM5-20]NDV54608.1 TonB-dependent receptor [Parabacteroides sp. 52]